MGTPVPPEYPEPEDGKYYRVGCDCFHPIYPNYGCQDYYFGIVECCQLKSTIEAYGKCPVEFLLCDPYSITTTQRVIYAHGPYDTLEDCEADL